MGLGSTAKKVQLIAEKAESTYDQLMKIRDRMIRLEDTLDDTSDRVTELERENEIQRVLLEELAAERGIDVDDALEDAGLGDEEQDSTDQTATADDSDDTDSS